MSWFYTSNNLAFIILFSEKEGKTPFLTPSGEVGVSWKLFSLQGDRFEFMKTPLWTIILQINQSSLLKTL